MKNAIFETNYVSMYVLSRTPNTCFQGHFAVVRVYSNSTMSTV